MKYLLDTDALSEPVRRRPSERFLRTLDAHAAEVAISSISVGEIVFGALRIPNGERYLAYLQDVVLPRVPVLPIEVAVASRYGAIRSELARAGRTVADLDLLIAATALTHELVVVTRNVRHFGRIPKLELADWFEPSG